jgi:hypothetical protein
MLSAEGAWEFPARYSLPIFSTEYLPGLLVVSNVSQLLFASSMGDGKFLDNLRQHIHSLAERGERNAFIVSVHAL